MKSIFLIPVFVLTVGIIHAHDIHVSVTELVQNRQGSLELTIKIFYDDLLSAVGLIPGEELPEDYTSSDDLIEKYLSKHVSIKINGKPYRFEYIETVASMPALWVYLQLEKSEFPEIKSLEITNSIFVDLFSDQTNMVNVRVNDSRKSKALNGKERNMELEY